MNLREANESMLDPRWVAHFAAYLPAAVHTWDKEHHKDMALNSYGVEASTIRAIHLGQTGKGGRPLSCYVEWARQAAADVLAPEAAGLRKNINSAAGFEAWHKSLAASLSRHWLGAVRARSHALNLVFDEEKDGLSIAHLYKMVNLFVRFMRIPATARGHMDLAKGIRQFGHVPLDRKSITTLQKTFGNPIPRFNGYSMGTITSQSLYDHHQQLARTLCRQIPGATPVLFDVFAWNADEAKKLYPTRPQGGRKGP
jgi:hypothetical protein